MTGMKKSTCVKLGIVFGIVLSATIVSKDHFLSLPIEDTAPEEEKKYENYVSYPGEVPLALNCSKCALVVGSGHLLGSKKGSEIDSMDCVIRSNDAPTVGFEEDVGTITTIRSVDRRSMEILWKSRKKLLEHDGSSHYPPTIILSIFHPPTIKREFVNAKKVFPRLQLFASTTKKYEELLSVFHNRVTSVKIAEWSSGFRTIYFAHEVCDVIHVYGVNDENFCKLVLANDPGYVDVPYHYYGPLTKLKNCGVISRHDQSKTAAHSFTKEKILFRKLMAEWGNLYFHAPEWMNNTQD